MQIYIGGIIDRRGIIYWICTKKIIDIAIKNKVSSRAECYVLQTNEQFMEEKQERCGS